MSNRIFPIFRSLTNENKAQNAPVYVAEKGWGKEVWMENRQEPSLCFKYMMLEHNKRCSLHYHLEKDELFFVISGSMMFIWIDPETSEEKHLELRSGDSVFVPKGLAHQFGGVSEKSCHFIELSTFHADEDSYRVRPGSSQSIFG
ncbi:MAG: cupin domain-containing protein [Candidatus Hodarchaeales archaeon]|jgi:mannose-6-phosphate isomerase-like protein (cupin superfamily)